MTYYKFLFIVPPDLARAIADAAWTLRMTKADFVRDCIRSRLRDIKHSDHHCTTSDD
jgi:hypothetical protein